MILVEIKDGYEAWYATEMQGNDIQLFNGRVGQLMYTGSEINAVLMMVRFDDTDEPFTIALPVPEQFINIKE